MLFSIIPVISFMNFLLLDNQMMIKLPVYHALVIQNITCCQILALDAGVEVILYLKILIEITVSIDSFGIFAPEFANLQMFESNLIL